jgi:RNA-directed DNA polymerase
MSAKEAEARASAAPGVGGRRNLPGTDGGAEAGKTAGEQTKPEALRLMEAVVERSNMLCAYKRVVKNQGAPGVDGLTTTELKPWLQAHWGTIREELLAGRYVPAAVRKVEIPKPQGIPTVLDRLIQQALHQVLQPMFEPEFSESSYGFRPGRNAHQAVEAARSYVAEGKRWVVDLDLEKFFDRVNHDILMARVARKVKDKRVLKLIRRYLTAGLMEGGVASAREEGTPQGGPLSPLLSNILLTDLDRELESRGHRFCRYADDCNIYVSSQRAGERVMAAITEFLEKQLKLQVNADKSAVARPWQRKFLGYSMTWHRKPKLKIAEPSRKRFTDKVRKTLKAGRSQNLKRVIDELNPLLHGWMVYYRLTEQRGVLEELDGWIRRKLRALLWRQWKRAHTRMQNLVRNGIDAARAWQSATNGRGPWWNGGASHMHQAHPKVWFDRMELISLLDIQRRFLCVS